MKSPSARRCSRVTWQFGACSRQQPPRGCCGWRRRRAGVGGGGMSMTCWCCQSPRSLHTRAVPGLELVDGLVSFLKFLVLVSEVIVELQGQGGGSGKGMGKDCRATTTAPSPYRIPPSLEPGRSHPARRRVPADAHQPPAGLATGAGKGVRCCARQWTGKWALGGPRGGAQACGCRPGGRLRRG